MSIEPLPLVPGAGPRIVSSSDDVAKRLPDGLSAPASDPVRDLLVDALAALAQEYEAASDHAVAQSDIARAVQQYLAALAGDRGAGKARGEGDEAVRARSIGQQACVTETAIIAGVNAILSLVTTTECQLVDGALDGWFIHDGTDGNGGPPQWHSFVGGPPNYPDRLTSDDSANNGGAARPNSAVGGARVFKDAIGRLLLLRLPDVGFQLRDAAVVFEEGTEATTGFFVGDGTTTPVGAFLDASSIEPGAMYRAIANFMSGALGQSVRWEMDSDIVAA